MADESTLVIVGAGGFGAEVLDYARLLGMRVRGFLDDTKAAGWDARLEAPILGPIDAFRPNPNDQLVLAIGEPRHRREVASRLGSARWATLVHPTATVSASALVEPGTIIGPYAYVGPHATLGDHAVLNTHVSFGHDARLGAFGAICPLASIGGGATLGEGVFVGAQAVVTPQRVVGAWARIAAGAVVFHDVPARGEAMGNPARTRVPD
jgi:sugar O-acyltransferase (sialic acid O-acetyltransferase NeuD family)